MQWPSLCSGVRLAMPALATLVSIHCADELPLRRLQHLTSKMAPLTHVAPSTSHATL